MKLSLEENAKYSDEILKPMIALIDTAVNNYSVERLKETLKSMEVQVGALEALPFPGTRDKADKNRLINEIYKHIICLLEIRIKQRDLAIKQIHGTTGQQVLKKMGFL